MVKIDVKTVKIQEVQILKKKNILEENQFVELIFFFFLCRYLKPQGYIENTN